MTIEVVKTVSEVRSEILDILKVKPSEVVGDLMLIMCLGRPLTVLHDEGCEFVEISTEQTTNIFTLLELESVKARHARIEITREEITVNLTLYNPRFN